jgi:hypothetical protein
MRPERREHEAGFEEKGLDGSCRVFVAHRHVSGRGVEPLHGRQRSYTAVGRRLHTGKNRVALWLGALSSTAAWRLRRHLGIAVAGLLLLALFLTAPIPLPAQGVAGMGGTATSTCAHVRLKNAPSWVVSGAWRGPRNLTLIDSFKSRIVDYRIDPRSNTARPQELAQDMRDQHPVRIQAGGLQGPKLFIEFDGNRFRAVDDRMRTVGREENIVGASVPVKGVNVGSLFDWQIAAGNVVAYGAVVHATTDEEWNDLGNWDNAFIRYPYGQQWSIEIFRKTKFPDPGEVFYRLGYPMLAAVGRDVYALAVEDSFPVLYRFPKDGPPVRLAGALPREIADRRLPTLPNLVVGSDYRLVMKTVEESRMPAGLYGWNNSLFVLYRAPESQGTRWTIARIAGGQVTKLVPLPTRANHVTLIPGPEHWALLEKGPIQELGNQELQQVILIPSTRFEGNLQTPLCSN